MCFEITLKIPLFILFTLFPAYCVGDWEHWNKKVQPYFYPTDSIPEYSSILVPNVDNVRTNFLIDTIAKQHKVSLIVPYKIEKKPHTRLKNQVPAQGKKLVSLKRNVL